MKSRLVTAAALALWSQIALAATPTAQLTGQVRLVKSDGKTVLAQAAPLLVSPAGTAAGKLPEITVSDKDAFLTALGRCAFNLQYDEVSATAVAGSTNRLYSNDALIAQNTQITLEPKAVKTIWTQPYLVAGANNVRLVINADSGAPSTGWVRIHVTGTCGKPAATAPAPAPVVEPKPAPAPAPVSWVQPGSGDWNRLNNAWGYSNYAVTQLQGRGFAKYDALVRLNAAISAAIKAKKIASADYASLMAAWNALLADPGFKAAMAAVVPKPGVK